MKFFITFGTHDFLKTIYEKYRDKHAIYLLDGGGASALVLESLKKSIFKSGKSYEVIDASGDFARATFVVMNNIPVAHEDENVFRYEAKKRSEMMMKQPGCLGTRILKPIKGDNYIIVSMWDSAGDFKRFQASPHFDKQAGPSPTIPQEMFTGKAYLKKYTVYRQELED